MCASSHVTTHSSLYQLFIVFSHAPLCLSMPFTADMPLKEEDGHRGIITGCTHLTLANGADRYVTCSRDGAVKVWNAKVRLYFTCAVLLRLFMVQTSCAQHCTPTLDSQSQSLCVYVPHRQPLYCLLFVLVMQDMKLLKTIDNGPTWATCVKMLPGTRRLAVSSFSRCLIVLRRIIKTLALRPYSHDTARYQQDRQCISFSCLLSINSLCLHIPCTGP